MSELKGVQPVVRSEFNCFGSQVFSSRIKELERGVLILAGLRPTSALLRLHCTRPRIQGPRGQRRHILSLLGEPQSGTGENGTGRVTMSSTEMVIYELLKNSGREAFKQALKLVK